MRRIQFLTFPPAPLQIFSFPQLASNAAGNKVAALEAIDKVNTDIVGPAYTCRRRPDLSIQASSRVEGDEEK